jgi:hypothetical protein
MWRIAPIFKEDPVLGLGLLWHEMLQFQNFCELSSL